MHQVRQTIKIRFRHGVLYIRSLAKWLAIALVTGALCGMIGSIFHIGVHEASLLRAAHPHLLFLLPAADRAGR